jgi:hypothetical protein
MEPSSFRTINTKIIPLQYIRTKQVMETGWTNYINSQVQHYAAAKRIQNISINN